MADRIFRSYIFPEDDDVVFVGLDRWIERAENKTPLLGTYLCDAAEVNANFDTWEADLKRCRREALRAVETLRKRAEARHLARKRAVKT
jgi:hypothetical protein